MKSCTLFSSLFVCIILTMKVHVIVNPVAAAGKTLKVLKKIEPILEQGSHEYVEHFSSSSEGLDEIVSHILLTEKGIVNLLVLGGDGSMHDVINGMTDFSRVRIGFLPCGSGNDAIRDMNLPDDPIDVLNIFLEGKVRRTMDVGEVVFHNVSDIQKKNGMRMTEEPGAVRRFHVSAGIGFDADVCHGVAVSKVKRLFAKLHIAKLVYLFIALKVILENNHFAMHVRTTEGAAKLPHVLFLVAMNHRYEGGGFCFCPEAETDDGLLDLCVARNMTIPSFVRVFIHAFHGNHVRYTDHITMRRTKRILIETDKPLFVHLDGEVYCRSSKIEIRTGTDKLNMLI